MPREFRVNPNRHRARTLDQSRYLGTFCTTWLKVFLCLEPNIFSMCTGVALAGCTIAPVDPTWISEFPANARSFAVAQQAVRACYGENALDKFRRAGFGVATKPSSCAMDRTQRGSISHQPMMR
jgi:hypothetical protein